MATGTAVEKKGTGDVRRAEPMRSRRVYTPPVDIIEQKDGLLMLLDMPGVEPDGIHIQYENGLVTIHGKVQPREAEQAQYLLREYGTGDYYRSFTVGEGIDVNKIEACCKDGVVTLHLPKSEALKPRRIEVKGG